LLAWLIRHAESEANFGLATAQPAETPLTERGWEQARRLAAWLDEPPSLIVTSPYVRTKQTAQPARERFPEVPHEEWPVQEFTYLSGLHGRLTTAAERRPLVEAYWLRADPHHVDSPGSESFAGVLRRAHDTIDWPLAHNAPNWRVAHGATG
jgi:2,3-bisphosphoglycerate-dependent phosphoglycerate mutase